MRLFYWLIFSLCLVVPAIARAIEFSELGYDLAGSDNKGEWVELYNRSRQPIDLTGDLFFDGTNHQLIGPPEHGGQGNMVIQPDSYAILAASAADWLMAHPGFKGSVIDTVMSLPNYASNRSQPIRLALLAKDKSVIIETSYWPTKPGSEDYTLELAANGEWQNSVYPGGSPGQPAPSPTPTPITPSPAPLPPRPLSISTTPALPISQAQPRPHQDPSNPTILPSSLKLADPIPSVPAGQAEQLVNIKPSIPKPTVSRSPTPRPTKPAHGPVRQAKTGSAIPIEPLPTEPPLTAVAGVSHVQNVQPNHVLSNWLLGVNGLILSGLLAFQARQPLGRWLEQGRLWLGLSPP